MIVVKSLVGVLLGCLLIWIAGCVRVSDGTWIVREAAVPEGWPEVTPVGKIMVKSYPLYREAVVADADLQSRGMDSMFRTLFGHIKSNDIAMTAPVDMTFEPSDDADAASYMSTMAFLYRRPSQGSAGPEGAVEVRDLSPQTFVSVGVRGDYSTKRFDRHLPMLTSWLESNGSAWRRSGSPRYLGYNGPFTLPFMRYGEVQIPIESVKSDIDR